MEKTPKTTGSKATFERGVALVPPDKLVAWLDAQKRGTEARLIRVPIVMPKAQVGYGMQNVKLGGAADALAVNVTDTALGIGLGMKARKCKDATCAFLVEAYWRGKEGASYHLDVVKAGDPLTAAELSAITHAEVEGESGN